MKMQKSHPLRCLVALLLTQLRFPGLFLQLSPILPGIPDNRNLAFPEQRQLEIVMKHLIHRSFAIATLAAGLSFNAYAEPPSGRVDFGTFAAPDKGGEFVEVQINTNLISLAAQLVEKEQPEIAKTIRSVESIRVNVIGLTGENRDEMKKRVQKIRSDLDAKGWERNVNVQDKGGEDVGVYTRTRGGEALAGLAIIVIDKDDVVLANIVGDIKPSQVAALGESLDIKPLKEAAAAIKEAGAAKQEAGAATKK
jgi:hypothetical protein